ncbi:hypothetical protein UCDDA912_g08509 [Diaporthe ampelina]|uniref:Uncharacterized protein n=1 Tax=Diaporthe ampelina TaxID=1214573 RepID=A0A0G2FBK5_9PEZI|nr:hypothetical protein UCDDA912_g08509 [Diaporthe ampelina]
MGGGEGGAPVRECLCLFYDYCKCTGSYECFCFETKQENDATPQVDAVEERFSFEDADATEQSGTAEHFGVVERYDFMRGCVCGAFDQYGIVGQCICGAIEEHPTEEHGTAAEPTSVDSEEDPRIRDSPFVGRYRIEDTSNENLECGMYALGISTGAQLGLTLTEPDFRSVYTSPEMQAFNRAHGFENVVNNYYDEQLACVLRLWGHHVGLGDIQLGLILEGAGCGVIQGADGKFNIFSSEADMESERGPTTTWIHNDNVQNRLGVGRSHYSGVTLLGRSEGPENVSGAETGTEKGSVMEVGENEERGQETEVEDSVETAMEVDDNADGGQETEDGTSAQDSSTLSEAESSTEKGSDVEMGEKAEEEISTRAEKGSDTEAVDDSEEEKSVAGFRRESALILYERYDGDREFPDVKTCGSCY